MDMVMDWAPRMSDGNPSQVLPRRLFVQGAGADSREQHIHCIRGMTIRSAGRRHSHSLAQAAEDYSLRLVQASILRCCKRVGDQRNGSLPSLRARLVSISSILRCCERVGDQRNGSLLSLRARLVSILASRGKGAVPP
jgi:hypothetical protein